MNKRLLLVLISNYGGVISLGFYIPVFALYIVSLGGSVEQAGIATAIYYFGAGLLMLMFRLTIGNSPNRLKYYIAGNALETITALLFILTTTVPQFYLAQVVHALATALMVPAQRTLYAQFEDEGKEGSQWSIMEGGNFMIMGASAAVGGFVVEHMSFHAVFVCMAIIQAVATLLCFKLLEPKGLQTANSSKIGK